MVLKGGIQIHGKPIVRLAELKTKTRVGTRPGQHRIQQGVHVVRRPQAVRLHHVLVDMGLQDGARLAVGVDSAVQGVEHGRQLLLAVRQVHWHREPDLLHECSELHGGQCQGRGRLGSVRPLRNEAVVAAAAPRVGLVRLVRGRGLRQVRAGLLQGGNVAQHGVLDAHKDGLCHARKLERHNAVSVDVVVAPQGVQQVANLLHVVHGVVGNGHQVGDGEHAAARGAAAVDGLGQVRDARLHDGLCREVHAEQHHAGAAVLQADSHAHLHRASGHDVGQVQREVLEVHATAHGPVHGPGCVVWVDPPQTACVGAEHVEGPRLQHLVGAFHGLQGVDERAHDRAGVHTLGLCLGGCLREECAQDGAHVGLLAGTSVPVPAPCCGRHHGTLRVVGAVRDCRFQELLHLGRELARHQRVGRECDAPTQGQQVPQLPDGLNGTAPGHAAATRRRGLGHCAMLVEGDRHSGARSVVRVHGMRGVGVRGDGVRTREVGEGGRHQDVGGTGEGCEHLLGRCVAVGGHGGDEHAGGVLCDAVRKPPAQGHAFRLEGGKESGNGHDRGCGVHVEL